MPKIRTGRMYRVAKILENEDELDKLKFEFYMATWSRHGEHTCGTVGCIGGLVELLHPGEEARISLGISELQESSLFFMRDYRRSDDNPKLMGLVTAKEAATGLRNMARTGQCNWKEILEK